MKKLFLFAGTNLLLVLSFAQSKVNLVCRDFTFQREVSTTGKNLRNIFEIVISKSNYPFKVLERDKMDKFFETLQEEKNLVKDLATEWKKKLQMANIDYLVVGDLNENIATDNFDLLINFIKITGDNMTEKLPILITIGRKQISDKEELKKIFDKEIQFFLKSYFVNESIESSINVLPKFYEELKKRDSTIAKLNISVSELHKQNGLKDIEIKDLKQDVSNIKNYANMARLDIFGLEFHVGFGLTGGETSLSILMKSILEKRGDQVFILNSDTALNYANQVVEKFPNFPFGYYAKAKIHLSKKEVSLGLSNVFKALDIFEITTLIDGHKPDHDEAMADLNNNVLKPLGIAR